MVFIGIMNSPDMNDISGKPVILFDGICNLCSGIAQFIRKHDKYQIFKLMTLQSETGLYFLKMHRLDVNNYNSIILIENNKAFFKSEAVFQILNHLGGTWKTLIIFKFLPKKWNNYFYDLVARNRYKIFGQRKSCFIIE